VSCAYFNRTCTAAREIFYEDFGKSFLLSDVLVVTDIYPAREEPIQGVNRRVDCECGKQFGHKDVHYVADKNRFLPF